MKHIYKILILAISLVIMADVVLASGGNRTGTGGATQLQIPVGARSIAMGSSTIASAQGLEALYWNPAGIAITDRNVELVFSHMNYIADIGVEYGAVSARIEGIGVFAFNVKALSVGDIAITTTQDPDGTGSTFNPQMLTTGLSYSRALTDNIAVGLTGTFITETLGEVSASGFAFDIGVLYNNLADISGLGFGIAIKNLGPQMQYDGSGMLYQAEVDQFNRPAGLTKIDSAPFELPSQFEIGLSYMPSIDESNAVLFTGSFQNQNFSADEYKLGAEYSYNKMFFVRGGYSFASNLEGSEYIYGMTAGIGVNYNSGDIDLLFDYAYRDVEYFESNHVFSIAVGF
jgi:hypothetical protein